MKLWTNTIFLSAHFSILLAVYNLQYDDDDVGPSNSGATVPTLASSPLSGEINSRLASHVSSNKRKQTIVKSSSEEKKTSQQLKRDANFAGLVIFVVYISMDMV